MHVFTYYSSLRKNTSLIKEQNLANQEVSYIAKLADPEGIRTVGVMTKLDTL